MFPLHGLSCIPRTPPGTISSGGIISQGPNPGRTHRARRDLFQRLLVESDQRRLSLWFRLDRSSCANIPFPRILRSLIHRCKNTHTGIGKGDLAGQGMCAGAVAEVWWTDACERGGWVVCRGGFSRGVGLLLLLLLLLWWLQWVCCGQCLL